MEISPIATFSTSVDGMERLISNGKQLARNAENSQAYFEDVFNTVLTKELLKPLFQSELFSSNKQYGYLVENALTEHFNSYFNLINSTAGKE